MSDLLPTLLLLLTLGTPTLERPDQVLAPTGTGFGQPFDSFGHAVLIADGELLVGDPQAAAVYVFSPSLGQWRISERLSGPGRFGSALRRDAGNLAVTAPAAIDDFVPSGEGEVRFFKPASGAWELTQVLTDGTFGFGRGLSIDGDRALVGSFLPNLTEPGATGRVALFERSAGQWQSAGILLQNSRESSADCPPGGESTGECFVPGIGVSLAGADVVLEGAPFAQAATSRFFSASLVGNNSLILGQPSFPNSFRISVDGDRALAVGSGPRAGLADLYRLTNGQWQFDRAFQLAGCEITAAALQDAHITLAGPCGIGFFERTAGSWDRAQFVPLDEPTGFRSLSRSDFRLLAGAPSAAGAGGPEAGAIYLLEQSGGAWSVRDRLDAGDGVGADRFGTGVSVAGPVVVTEA